MAPLNVALLFSVFATLASESSAEVGTGIIILRRTDGNVPFDRNWEEYGNGFGDLSGNFWLGLNTIYKLCQNNCHLRIDMEYNNMKYNAIYTTFKIGSLAEKYKLKLGGFSGNATYDDFANQNGQMFTTKDEDNDSRPNGNCAALFTGGWWHKDCQKFQPTGTWGSKELGKGLNWDSITSWKDSLSSVTMTVYPSSTTDASG